MSSDPYQNIYYYYRGPTAKGSAKTKKSYDIQLENNTTKALINTLKHCNPIICQNFLIEMLKIPIESNDFKYLLQTQTIGEQKIKTQPNRILWVICSKTKCSKEIELPKKISPLSSEKSLPDAWIWNKNAVILIESKTHAPVDIDQLMKYKELLILDSDLIVSHWEEIHTYFIDLLNTNKSISDKDRFLLQEFSKYLELVSLSSFSGWNEEDFDFFHFYERDNIEAERMRTKMKLFASEILQHENLSKLLVDKGLGKLKYPLQNIWYQFDMKDSKFFIRTNVPFVNFTLELLPDSLQVTIVFPNFEAIDQLRDVLNSKKEKIIKKFKDVIEVEILNLTNHNFLFKTAEDREEDVSKIPTFKIKIFNHLSIIRDNKHWIPRNELTLDSYTIQDAYWFNFLKSNLNLYHPAKDRKPHWGAGVHILKQYRRGSVVLTQPKKLIADIQTTLQRFIDFIEILI